MPIARILLEGPRLKPDEAVNRLRRHIRAIQRDMRAVESHKPVRMQSVFAEAMEELSQIRSLGILFRTKERILESLVQRLSEIREEVHFESPIDGKHESKSMSRVCQLAVKAFDHLAAKVSVLEDALKQVNHHATDRCREVLNRMKALQTEGVGMHKRWREAKGTYDDYQLGLDELQSFMDMCSDFLQQAK